MAIGTRFFRFWCIQFRIFDWRTNGRNQTSMFLGGVLHVRLPWNCNETWRSQWCIVSERNRVSCTIKVGTHVKYSDSVLFFFSSDGLVRNWEIWIWCVLIPINNEAQGPWQLVQHDTRYPEKWRCRCMIRSMIVMQCMSTRKPALIGSSLF